jgi:hypothetical protein
MVKAFEVKVEPTLIQPTLVYGHPVEISPLAKPMADDPRYVERFEIFIGAMECGDNWSEQNDPGPAARTLAGAYREAERDEGKFHTLDFDFIECLEYGLPPTTGIGPGIERMAMIFTEQENIDDVIFFPLMRPVVSPINAQLYGIEKPAEPVAHRLGRCRHGHLRRVQTLCRDGAIVPHRSDLILRPERPDVVFGRPGCGHPVHRHADLEGFLSHGTIRITGIPLIHDQADAQAAADELVEFLGIQFPGRRVTVAAPTKTPPPPTEPHIEVPTL